MWEFDAPPDRRSPPCPCEHGYVASARTEPVLPLRDVLQNSVGMDERPVPLFRLAITLFLLACTLANGGCLAVDAVDVAGHVAVDAVKVTSRVVVTTVRVGADIAGDGPNATWRLSQPGVVVVYQPRSGLAWKMPLGPDDRLSMAEALGAAHVRVEKAVLVRDRRTYEIPRSHWITTPLVPGDVVVIKD